MAKEWKGKPNWKQTENMDGFIVFFLLAVLVAVVVQGISVYNKLNPLREGLREAEGNIEVCSPCQNKVLALCGRRLRGRREKADAAKAKSLDLACRVGEWAGYR